MDRPRHVSPVREHMVAGAGVPLFVREVGAGPPVVVVHGGPDFDHEYLLPEMDRLASSCHLFLYDQRGRGRSFDGTAPELVSMAAEVADLEQIRLAGGLDAMAIVGHSWGGLVALEYTLAHPDRVTNLVLMNTAPASHADATTLRRELARRRRADETRRMIELRNSPAFAAGDIATDAEYYRIHYRSTISDAALLDTLIVRLRRSFSPRGVQVARTIEDQLLAETWSHPDYDLIPQLVAAHVPTLAIHGDDDLVPLRVVERIVDAMPNAELLVLKECGHFSFLERPHEVVSAITEFLTRPTDP